jgi:hypothetical protein
MKNEEQLYKQMEEELRIYNEGFSYKQYPRTPKYDKDIFLRFRKWQQKRMAEGKSNEKV